MKNSTQCNCSHDEVAHSAPHGSCWLCQCPKYRHEDRDIPDDEDTVIIGADRPKHICAICGVKLTNHDYCFEVHMCEECTDQIDNPEYVDA